MATPREVEQKLNGMSDDEFEKFCEQYGGPPRSRERVVSEFAADPKHERRLCYLLGLKTEEEKRTEAAMSSAKSAVESAETTKLAVKTAVDALKETKSHTKARWCAVAIAAVSALIALGALVATLYSR